MKNLKSSLIVLCVITFSLVVSACSSLGLAQEEPTPQPVQNAPVLPSGIIAEGILEPSEAKYLAFLSPGRLAEVLVEKGDQVEAGEVLARLENTEEAQARLEASNLEVLAAEQSLDELNRTAELAHTQSWTALVQANQALVEAQRAWDAIDTQETQDEIEDANTQVADAQKALGDAQDDFEPYKELPRDNEQRKSAQQTLDDAEEAYSDAILSRDELINALALAEASLAQAEAAQQEAQFQYDQTMDGPDPDQLSLLELRLQSAQAAQTAAQAALDNLELKSPLSGTVMEVNAIPGEQVSPSNWVVLVVDDSEWFVRTTDLTELEVVDVEVGQEVEITPDAIPELVLGGQVEEISDVYRLQAGDTVYDVKIRLLDSDSRLKWGMSVEVEFLEK